MMTVRELIALLEKVPPDLKVIVSVYDGNTIRTVDVMDLGEGEGEVAWIS